MGNIKSQSVKAEHVPVKAEPVKAEPVPVISLPTIINGIKDKIEKKNVIGENFQILQEHEYNQTFIEKEKVKPYVVSIYAPKLEIIEKKK